VKQRYDAPVRARSVPADAGTTVPFVLIRDEAETDRRAIHALNRAAFGGAAEADLVDALREQVDPLISLVAEEGGTIVGHIMFSPVDLPGHPAVRIMGLAPMAVSPACQGPGIGSALVRAGLERCRELGAGAVVVLGHPDYYPRFGFSRASTFGIGCPYDAPEEALMVIELQAGQLEGALGTVHFHGAFDGL
jgi:putative acetyltransferase